MTAPVQLAPMPWRQSHRFDRVARPIADRHYNRQKPGTKQFVPPGRCLVLTAIAGPALWVSSWPFAEYTKHAWSGAWVNSTFRNEGAGLSSDLIRAAIAATRWRWPDTPALGMVTFVDRRKVRGKKHFGLCYRKAGFIDAICPKHQNELRGRKDRRGRLLCLACNSRTKKGLLALQLLPADMPDAAIPCGAQRSLFDLQSEQPMTVHSVQTAHFHRCHDDAETASRAADSFDPVNETCYEETPCATNPTTTSAAITGPTCARKAVA